MQDKGQQHVARSASHRYTTPGVHSMRRAKIQAAIETIYDKIFNEGRGELLPGLTAGPYIPTQPAVPGRHGIHC
jgi:hypothetical protein